MAVGPPDGRQPWASPPLARRRAGTAVTRTGSSCAGGAHRLVGEKRMPRAPGTPLGRSATLACPPEKVEEPWWRRYCSCTSTWRRRTLAIPQRIVRPPPRRDLLKSKAIVVAHDLRRRHVSGEQPDAASRRLTPICRRAGLEVKDWRRGSAVPVVQRSCRPWWIEAGVGPRPEQWTSPKPTGPPHCQRTRPVRAPGTRRSSAFEYILRGAEDHVTDLRSAPEKTPVCAWPRSRPASRPPAARSPQAVSPRNEEQPPRSPRQ